MNYKYKKWQKEWVFNDDGSIRTRFVLVLPEE